MLQSIALDKPSLFLIAQASAWAVLMLCVMIFAYRIGTRQMHILANLERVEETRMAYALFDKRYRIYEIVAFLLEEAIEQRIHAPQGMTQAYVKSALSQAKLLFPPDVTATLDDIWTKLLEYYALNRQMEYDSRVPQTVNIAPMKVVEHDLKWAQRNQQWLELNEWMETRLQTLPNAFPHLRLHDLTDGT